MCWTCWKMQEAGNLFNVEKPERFVKLCLCIVISGLWQSPQALGCVSSHGVSHIELATLVTICWKWTRVTQQSLTRLMSCLIYRRLYACANLCCSHDYTCRLVFNNNKKSKFCCKTSLWQTLSRKWNKCLYLLVDLLVLWITGFCFGGYNMVCLKVQCSSL